MARCPFATWVGTPNETPGGMVAYDGLILHRTTGSFAGAESWMQNPSAQVSAHFEIDHQTGELVELVDTADKAWAEANGNPRNISLEISGAVTDPVAPVAVTKIGQLLAWCHTTHGIALRVNDDPTPGVGGLGWHGMGGVAWGNHPDCPGDIVKNLRQTIVNDALADLQAPPVQQAGVPCVGTWDCPSGGYWQVGSDGGVFSYGGAPFHGSLGGKPLAAPIAGMIVDPKGRGYWLVGEDGGVFCFGVPFYGSMGGKPMNAPVIGGRAAVDGAGYALTGRDYGLFDFGTIPYFGHH